MGLRLSCIENEHLFTLSDSIGKTITDEEITEFLANSAGLSESHGKSEKTKNTQLEIKNIEKLKIEFIPKYYNRSAQGSPTKGPLTGNNKNLRRIFSSNATQGSVNIIEKIIKSHSICSTNANSSATSRCVSPNAKPKPMLID